MARRMRVTPAGIPQHVIQRGNNRQICFASDSDRRLYLSCLKGYAEAYEVEIHAWVLMTNHVHLLCTPGENISLPRMMQALGRMYVRSFNQRYKRTGTLWEGRYRSCLIDSESYMLELYRYIELNPVRAGMVDEPGAYRWSSYRRNAWGRDDGLCISHALYLSLGPASTERMRRYRTFFETRVDDDLLTEIRRNTNRGVALGNNRFVQQIEALTGQRVTPGRPGRGRKRGSE